MKYLALLRGINVGGNNKVEMSKLKKIFESLGFSHVSTYINSGNIIFESNKKDVTKITEEIEKSLHKNFKFKIQTLVRDQKNIQTLCKKIPKTWTNDEKQRTDILFLWNEFDTKKSIKLIKTTPNVDLLKYISGAIVWNMDRKHYNKSSMKKFIGTPVYKNMTARNVNTVRKLGALLG